MRDDELDVRYGDDDGDIKMSKTIREQMQACELYGLPLDIDVQRWLSKVVRENGTALPDNPPKVGKSRCEKCDGEGWVNTQGWTCEACKGTGYR